MPTLLNYTICGRPYTLEECTMDKRGRAVHYQCLADQIERQEMWRIQSRTNQRTHPNPAKRHRNSVGSLAFPKAQDAGD